MSAGQLGKAVGSSVGGCGSGKPACGLADSCGWGGRSGLPHVRAAKANGKPHTARVRVMPRWEPSNTSAVNAADPGGLSPGRKFVPRVWNQPSKPQMKATVSRYGAGVVCRNSSRALMPLHTPWSYFLSFGCLCRVQVANTDTKIISSRARQHARQPVLFSPIQIASSNGLYLYFSVDKETDCGSYPPNLRTLEFVVLRTSPRDIKIPISCSFSGLHS